MKLLRSAYVDNEHHVWILRRNHGWALLAKVPKDAMDKFWERLRCPRGVGETKTWVYWVAK